MDPLTRDLFRFLDQQQGWRWLYSGFFKSLKTAGLTQGNIKGTLSPTYSI